MRTRRRALHPTIALTPHSAVPSPRGAALAMGWLLVVSTSLWVDAGLCRSAHAEPPVAASASTERAHRRADLQAALRAEDADAVRRAVEALREADDPETVTLLSALLRSGVPSGLVDLALVSLGETHDADALPVLVEFTQHRRPGARRRAYLAVANIPGPEAHRVLEQGLADQHQSVRAACATALGNAGSAASVARLFEAWDRGVPEAATAIGKLGEKESIARFGQRLTRVRLPVMLAGYREYLTRTDIDSRAKVEIVQTLGEVSGPAVSRFLEDYLKTLGPASKARASARATEQSRPPRDRLRAAVVDVLAHIPGSALAVRGRSVPAGRRADRRTSE